MNYDPELACNMIEHLARHFMASEGMPSLVINAPEDEDDRWRIYPSGGPCIGEGRSLGAALEKACDHPQIPSRNEPLGDK